MHLKMGCKSKKKTEDMCGQLRAVNVKQFEPSLYYTCSSYRKAQFTSAAGVFTNYTDIGKESFRVHKSRPLPAIDCAKITDKITP